MRRCQSLLGTHHHAPSQISSTTGTLQLHFLWITFAAINLYLEFICFKDYVVLMVSRFGFFSAQSHLSTSFEMNILYLWQGWRGILYRGRGSWRLRFPDNWRWFFPSTHITSEFRAFPSSHNPSSQTSKSSASNSINRAGKKITCYACL